ncbi:MAG: hypothetical protein WC635_11540 [Bacteriovorax sp.]|jgi:hypothetical protein
MFKYFLIFSLVLFSDLSMAKSNKVKKRTKHKKNKVVKIKKTTAYSFCQRQLTIPKSSLVEKNEAIQAVIVAIENASESKCKTVGKNKAEQYTREGWKCNGLNDEEMFSCESNKASSFAKYKDVILDHLLFTNLKNQHALIAYLNRGSYKTCLEDKAELELGGVTDATCNRRDP